MTAVQFNILDEGDAITAIDTTWSAESQELAVSSSRNLSKADLGLEGLFSSTNHVHDLRLHESGG